jgi:Biopterin-dependent aromatic amino acid hydroxylase
MSYSVLEEEAPTVPYFPVQIEELDDLKQQLQSCGQDETSNFFNAPQYRDKEYLARKKQITDIAHTYKLKDPIPIIDYSESETKC